MSFTGANGDRQYCDLTRNRASSEKPNSLQVCQAAGIIDKAEKKQLMERLDLRNDCGHPNSLIEFLLQNVYEKY